MYYAIEREAEFRRNELLREAEQVRLTRVFASSGFSIRQLVGRLLVRLGSRLDDEPQGEPSLVIAANESA